MSVDGGSQIILEAMRKVADEKIEKSVEKELQPKQKKKRAVKETLGKRPATGFIRFLNENRDIIKLCLPEDEARLSKNVSKKAGEMWKRMSDADKQKYNSVYEAEMDEWRSLNGIISGKEKARLLSVGRSSNIEAIMPVASESSFSVEEHLEFSVESPEESNEVDEELSEINSDDDEVDVELSEMDSDDDFYASDDDDCDVLFIDNGYAYLNSNGELYRINSTTRDLEKDMYGSPKKFGSIEGNKVVDLHGNIFGTLKNGIFSKDNELSGTLPSSSHNSEEEEEDDFIFEYDGYKYFILDARLNNIYRMNAETGDFEEDEDGYSKQFGTLKGDKVITEEGEVFGTLKDGVFTKQQPINKKKLLVKSSTASLKK